MKSKNNLIEFEYPLIKITSVKTQIFEPLHWIFLMEQKD